jgi:hypothetical protein
MQANPTVRLDAENLAEAAFEHFKCPVELVVPYLINDSALTGPVDAYQLSRFKSSLWNMDSPWMMAIFGTLGCNFIGFVLFAMLRAYFPDRAFTMAFTGFALSSMLGIPFIYAALVAANLRLGYGRYWWRQLSAPTHIGITELGFKLYVRGKLFYNYPNLAVWKDIKDVDIVNDGVYNVPAIKYRINSNYTFKVVVLPITGFSSEKHLLFVLQHLRQHVDKLTQSQHFIDLANAQFKPLLAKYAENTSVQPVD